MGTDGRLSAVAAVLVIGALFGGPAVLVAEHIVFVSDRNGEEVIWRMAADGAGPRPLTAEPPRGFGDQTPHASANGGRIALTTYRFGGWKIATMAADGTDLRRVTESPKGSAYEWSPQWSPDGETVVFSRFRTGSGIYLVGRDGSGQRRLTDNDGDRFQERTGQPRWFPDGERIIFASRTASGFDLRSMDVDGGEPTAVTSDPGHEISPAVSPDGRRVAFYSDREGVFDLYVKDLRSDEVRRLTHHASNPRAYAPQDTIYQLTAEWSPDGSRLAYVAVVDGRDQVFVVGGDGEDARQLTSEGSNRMPTWSTTD